MKKTRNMRTKERDHLTTVYTSSAHIYQLKFICKLNYLDLKIVVDVDQSY